MDCYPIVQRKFQVIGCCTLVLLVVLVAVVLCLYALAIFTTSTFHSKKIAVVEGDYVLLPFRASGNVMYGMEITIALADHDNLEHTTVDIFKVLCDMLPVSFKNASDSLEIDFTDYSNCSYDICVFDQFVYVAVTDHNESVIGYNIVMKNFIPGITNAQVLAFKTESYLLKHMKPLKAIEITERNFNFTLEIKVSSYYSFAIKFNNGSFQEFSFSQIGIYSYYNASNMSSWCGINSSKSTCANSVAITNPFPSSHCFLAHIQEENNDPEVTFKQVSPQSIKQEVQPAATPSGYFILVSVLLVILLSSSIGFFSCCQVIKKRKQRNELATDQQQQGDVMPHFQSNMSQFIGSSTSTEISFVYSDEDGDGGPFCVVSLSMAEKKGNINKVCTSIV